MPRFRSPASVVGDLGLRAAAGGRQGAAPDPAAGIGSDQVLPFIERASGSTVSRHCAEAGWRTVQAWILASPVARFEVPGLEDHHLVFHLSERSRMGLGFGGGRVQDHVLMTGAASFVPAGLSAVVEIQSANESLHVLLPRRLLEAVSQEAAVAPDLRPLVGLLTPELVSTATALHRELVEPRLGSSALADGLLQVLAVHVLREFVPAEVARRDRVWMLSDRQVRQAIGFMRANLQEDLSLKDMAEAVGLSVFHFARAFRASVGVPPHRYLVQLRISRARELLAAGSLPLAQVASETGFKSQSHFTYAFRRALHMTPREYRRIAKG